MLLSLLYRLMIRKKICMLGTSAVGKTSLIARFVHGIFSESYLTTIGVRIDQKILTYDDHALKLMIWDLNGEDRFQKLSMSYLRGAAGYFLVVDSTRAPSLDTALSLHERAQEAIGEVPFVVLLNKVDLKEQWDLDPSALADFRASGYPILDTSAKTGTGVEEAFDTLSALLLSNS